MTATSMPDPAPITLGAGIPVSSREVSFDSVLMPLHAVIKRAERYGRIPTLGTPAWNDLPDHDPRRVGAIYHAALIWALRQENAQRGFDEAATELAASGRASLAHRRRRDITDFYEQHPDLRRKAS